MGMLEDHILDLQVKNFESAYFIPIEKLDQLLTGPVVHDAIKTSGIDVQKRLETESIIQSGAKRIFAILVLMRKESLIRHFIEHDQFQTGELDAKLPFYQIQLQDIVDEKSARLFCQKQWAFIAPHFRNDLSYRALEDDVILPFISSRFVGSGGFGKVFEVVLERSHQGVSAINDCTAVRPHSVGIYALL